MSDAPIDMARKGILIVEDDVSDARNLKIIVENLGYRVCGIAPSGRTALDLMKQVNCGTSLVLVNMALKGPLDGIETARLISRDYPINLVFLKSKDDTLSLDQSMSNARPYAVINKPFNLGLIEHTIKGAFESSLGQKAAATPAKGEEKRREPRIKALDFPWERADINVDGQSVQMILQNLSRHGIGGLCEAALRQDLMYPVEISLPQPNGSVKGTAHVRYSLRSDVYTYYGFFLEFDETNEMAWDGYIRYRSQDHSK